MKTSLFGLIALLVLTVSVSSAFETAYADEDDPIRIILDITHQNILDSIEIAIENGDLDPVDAAELITSVETEYQAALDLTNGEDVVAAKESVLQAMSSFEVVAAGIEALDNQASTQLPPGFGAGFDSALDTGITQGQGLGVGGIPPGILKQITAANIFEIQEGITGIDNEVNELRGLIESNGLDVNLEEYDKSINLAKEVLANGDIPNAQAKLALANEIKGDLYDQIDAAVEEAQDERVEQFAENSIKEIESILEKGENLGLTKKVIDELQDTLDVLKSGDIDDIIEKTSDDSEFAKEVKGNDKISNEFDDGGPGNSENAPGQSDDDGPGNSENAPGQSDDDGHGNSGDAPGQNKEDSPGNSGDAPGQNRGNDEAELPPGFDSASDTGKANGNGQGLGLGKIPPGLAKLFGYDDGTGDNKDFEAPEDIPGFGAAIDSASDEGLANGQGIGLGKIPPGLMKFVTTDSPDDYWENHFEGESEDSYEKTYDGTNRGHASGKGLFGAHPLKTGVAPGSLQADISSGGKKPFCAGKGIAGNPAIILLGSTPVFHTISTTYTDAGARACEPGITEITDDIIVAGLGFDVNTADVYLITYDVTSAKFGAAATVTRTVGVGEFNPLFEVLVVRPPPVFELVSTSDFTTNLDLGGNPNDDTYFVGTIQNIFSNGSTLSAIGGDYDEVNGPLKDGEEPAVGTYTVTYTVTDDSSGKETVIVETVIVDP